MKKAGIVFAALLLVAVITGTATAAEKVYYQPPFGGPVYKPKRIVFHDTTLKDLRWRHWNSRRARGRGRARINTCEPICATGKIVRGPVRLRMFGRHREGDRLFYRCMVGTARAGGRKYRISWPYDCD
jgi:hypothetical protein